IGGLGDDEYVGGVGTDTAVIADGGGAAVTLGDFTVTGASVDGSGAFSGQIAGPDGTETLSGIEVIEVTNTGSSTFLVYDGMSIQAAIDAASHGDTILVGAGDYSAEGKILITDKALSISGALAGVSPTGDNWAGQAPGSETIIDGFTLTGTGGLSLDGVRLLGTGPESGNGLSGIQAYSSGDLSVVNSVIQVDGSAEAGLSFSPAGIDVSGTNGDITVDNVLFTAFKAPADPGASHTEFPYGIYLNYGDAVTARDVSVTSSKFDLGGSGGDFGFPTAIATDGRTGDEGSFVIQSNAFEDTAPRFAIGHFDFSGRLQDDGNNDQVTAGPVDFSGVSGNTFTDTLGSDANTGVIDNRSGFVIETGPNTIDGVAYDKVVADVTVAADTTISSTADDEFISGDDGLDVVTFTGNFADYTINVDASGAISITDTRSGAPDGSDTLIGIEALQFADGFGVVDGMSIQAAVDAASDGDTINVGAGTYAESLSVNKALTLTGVADGAGNRPIIDTAGNGIQIAGDIDAGGSESVSISGFAFENNSVGVRVSSGAVLSSLSIDDSVFKGNTVHGVGTGSGAPGLGSINITNSDFEDNGGGGSNGTGDIILFGYTGDATIENVDIISTLSESAPTASKGDNAIQIAGFDPATYDVTEPIGTVFLNNVNVTGAYHKPHLAIQGYTDLSAASFTGVTLNGSAEWGYLVFVDPVASPGTAGAGASGYPGSFAGGAATSTLDLSGVTVTNTSSGNPGFDVFVRGSDAADVQTGTEAADLLNAPAETGIDYGGDDTLSGLGGDDTLIGGLGNDSIDGGLDSDTAVYAGNFADYTITPEFDVSGAIIGFSEVTDNNAGDGDEGTDTLTGVEVLAFADAAFAVGDPVVVTDGGGGFVGSFTTIKAAVDAAPDGSTISIASGSVVVGGAQVVIDKDLTILGAGIGATTILADFSTGGAGDARGLFLVGEGVTLDVSDLTVDGDGNDVHQAFRHRGSGSFESVGFNDIQFPGYAGTAIVAFGTASDVDVTNSTFTDIGRVGVLYFGDGVTGIFQDNTYTGKGAGDHLDYALDISAGADIDVIGNTVSQNLGEASSDGSTSAAFLVSTFFASGTQADFQDNDVDGSTTGIAVGFNADDSSTVNILSGNSFDGLTSNALNINGNAVVTGVPDITGDSATVNWNGGDQVNLIEGGDLGDVLSGGEGNDRLIGGLGDDEYVGGVGTDTAVIADGGGAAVTLGDFTVTGASVDGSGAFSGQIAGPDGTETLSGIEVIEVTNTGSSTFLVYDGMSIQAAIDAASHGDTILVGAGDYSAEGKILITDKALSISGALAGVSPTGDNWAGQAPGSETIIDGFTLTGTGGLSLDGVRLLGTGPESGNGLSGIQAYSSGDLSVVNSVIQVDGSAEAGLSFSPAGIDVSGTNGDITVDNVLFTAFKAPADPGASHTEFPYGIYLNYGDAVTARDVSVTSSKFDLGGSGGDFGFPTAIATDGRTGDEGSFVIQSNAFEDTAPRFAIGHFDFSGRLQDDGNNDQVTAGPVDFSGVSGNTFTDTLGSDANTGVIDNRSGFVIETGPNTIDGVAYDKVVADVTVAADTTISSTADDEFISGDDGLDVVTFTGNFADYTINVDASGAISITDTRSGAPDGSDTLIGIEALQFADGFGVVDGMSIQAAVDAASDGDTINVGAGT
ncbi:hypothetical protein DKT77_05295, partial [Meridianimarinicoccus roseus]